MIRCFLILTSSNAYNFISTADDMVPYVNTLMLDYQNPDFEKADFLGWECVLPSIPQKGTSILMNSFKEEMLRQWICKLRKGDSSIKVLLKHLRVKESKYEMLLHDEDGNPYTDEQVIKHVIMGPPVYQKEENIERVLENNGVKDSLVDGMFQVHDSDKYYDDREGVINFIPNKNYVVITLTHTN